MRILPFTKGPDGKAILNPFEMEFPCVIGRIAEHHTGNKSGKARTRWSNIRRSEIVVVETNRPYATIINTQAELDEFLKAAAKKGDEQNIFVEPAK